MDCEFSIYHYEFILGIFRLRDYRFSTLSRPLEGKCVYLRHDIDISIDSALQLAQRESNLRIPATYHVMIASPYYNTFEQSNIEKLREIVRLGHEVGLHFDTRQPWIRKQAELLGAALGTEIKSVSQDGLFGPKQDLIIGSDEVIDASQFPAKYISDSCMHWREGCMCQWINKADQLQILVHPEWWVQADQTTQLIKKFREHMRANNHD